MVVDLVVHQLVLVKVWMLLLEVDFVVVELGEQVTLHLMVDYLMERMEPMVE